MTARPMPQLIEADRQIVESVKGALDSASRIYSTDKGVPYEERRVALHDADARAIDRLTEAGATIKSDFRGATIRFRGVSSSCTAGLRGALSNWLTAARKRLSEQGETK